MGMLAVLKHVAMAKLKKIILRCAEQSYHCSCLRVRDILLMFGYYSMISSIMECINVDKWDENVMIILCLQCYVLSIYVTIFTIKQRRLKVTDRRL